MGQQLLDRARVLQDQHKVALPTRVLDIGAANATGRLNLFETDGQSSKYIALSHCWGGLGGTDENMQVLFLFSLSGFSIQFYMQSVTPNNENCSS
jgi:hypothetical protein